MPFWVRRTQVTDITIDDLGITVPANNGERDLQDSVSYEDILKSSDLSTAITSANLVRIDGPAGAPIPVANAFDDTVTTHTFDNDSHIGTLDPEKIAPPTGLAEKLLPANADLVIISDSAAAWAPKKAQLGNLPGGGGGTGPGTDMKGNEVLAASFAGNPKTATVTFTTAYADANYSISLGCVASAHVQFVPIVENKAAGGFDINMGCNNINGLIAVTYSVAPYGEA